MIGMKKVTRTMGIFPMLRKFKETLWPTGHVDKYPFEQQSVSIDGRNFILRKSDTGDTGDFMNIQEKVYSQPVPWPVDIVDMELRNKNALYLSLVENKTCVAFIGVSLKSKNEAHITNIAVLPELQHLGIGHLFLNQVFDYCRKYEFLSLSLEADIENDSAISLYRAFGFKTRTIHEKYYFRNHHDALEMVVDL